MGGELPGEGPDRGRRADLHGQLDRHPDERHRQQHQGIVAGRHQRRRRVQHPDRLPVRPAPVRAERATHRRSREGDLQNNMVYSADGGSRQDRRGPPRPEDRQDDDEVDRRRPQLRVPAALRPAGQASPGDDEVEPGRGASATSPPAATPSRSFGATPPPASRSPSPTSCRRSGSTGWSRPPMAAASSIRPSRRVRSTSCSRCRRPREPPVPTTTEGRAVARRRTAAGSSMGPRAGCWRRFSS